MVSPEKEEKKLVQKALIITYYWPPAGGPGVQRWLKFVTYLREFDIEPVVYIPKNPHYPLTDASLNSEIPTGIKIYTHPIFEPYRLASLVSKRKTQRISAGVIETKKPSFLEKMMLWIRGNLFVPDARKFWVGPSVRFLSEVIQKENIHVIVTTGPPHSVHLIGEKLQKAFAVQWLADFRDPWTSIGYHNKLRLTKTSQRKHKEMEHRILNCADRIVVTSETTKKEFGALTDRPIAVITNGYDGDFQKAEKLDTKFTISHIGSLLTGRNPENLWRVLAALIQENKAFEKAILLKFIGTVSREVQETLFGYGLEHYVKFMGYLSHEEAIRQQKQSQILLLAEIDAEETKGIIPGKLFEYMAAGRPILGIGPEDWEVGGMVCETNSGKTFGYQDDDALKRVLLEWFEKYQGKKLSVSTKNIEQYSRRELTKKMAAQIRWGSY